MLTAQMLYFIFDEQFKDNSSLEIRGDVPKSQSADKVGAYPPPIKPKNTKNQDATNDSAVVPFSFLAVEQNNNYKYQVKHCKNLIKFYFDRIEQHLNLEKTKQIGFTFRIKKDIGELQSYLKALGSQPGYASLTNKRIQAVNYDAFQNEKLFSEAKLAIDSILRAKQGAYLAGQPANTLRK